MAAVSVVIGVGWDWDVGAAGVAFGVAAHGSVKVN
jgi:hypothetical protein